MGKVKVGVICFVVSLVYGDTAYPDVRKDRQGFNSEALLNLNGLSDSFLFGLLEKNG